MPAAGRSSTNSSATRVNAVTRAYGWSWTTLVDRKEIDFLWRDLQFGVELDGWDGHSSRQAFERDRLKRAKLQAHGVGIMPVTGRQIRNDAAGVMTRLMAGLREAAAVRRSRAGD